MSYRNQVHISLTLTLVLLGLGVAGCTIDTASLPTTVPSNLAIELRTVTTDGRLSFFQISPGGQLAFGGGREALLYQATPVATLTTQQLQALWDLVREHRLLEAKNTPFAQAKAVTYQLKIRFNGKERSVRVIDDIPGLKTLHDTLLGLYSSYNYQ